MENEELKTAADPRLLPPAFEVAGSRGQQDVVGMPIQAEDRGADGLFNVLAHPPTKGEDPFQLTHASSNHPQMTHRCVPGETSYTGFSQGRRVSSWRGGAFIKEWRKGDPQRPFCSPVFQALTFSPEQPVLNCPSYQGILVSECICRLILVPPPPTMDFQITCDSNLRNKNGGLTSLKFLLQITQ